LHASWRAGQGIVAKHLVTDKGYDTNTLVKDTRRRGMTVGLPPRKHRVTPRNDARYTTSE
jgi:hypothetical protein